MRITSALWLVLAFVLPASAQTPLPFSDGRWELNGDAKVETLEGRPVIAIATGAAIRRDVRMQDGTVDLDVQLTPRRSFVYIKFRMQSDTEYEEMYLRPHKSNLPDALQYAPVFDGQSAWQLFHGPGGTAAAGFEAGTWTHVRLVLKGPQAALFVGDMAKPALVVPRLARTPAPGHIAIQGFLPANVPGSGAIATYANVEVRPEHVPFDFSPIPVPNVTEPDAVRGWLLSKPLTLTRAAAADLRALPADLFGQGARTAPAEASGLVLLNRFIAKPAGAAGNAAAARVIVRADQAGPRRLDLGFSDTATVFLNGQPIYYGDAHYSFDVPRQEGLIGFDQAALYLPLRAGENELVVVVTDVFGGWALQGRFKNARGLSIEAR